MKKQDELINELISLFVGLKVPKFYSSNEIYDYNVLAFFTELGLEHFKNSIDKVIKTIERKGLFSVGTVLIPEDNQEIIYRDEFQVLIKNPKNKKVNEPW